MLTGFLEKCTAYHKQNGRYIMKRFFTSESVTEGHPDKICDQISDAIVDEILKGDPEGGRVAAETTVNTGYAMVMGEISTSCYVDIPKLARKVICDIGYDRGEYGFDGNTCAVMSAIDEQSGDIAMGVDRTKSEDSFDSIGAGDQGIMFGFACDETPELMPLPISLAHKLSRQLAKVRKEGTLTYLRPDGKTQVTVEYDDDEVVRVDTVLVSAQHDPDVTQEQIKEDIIKYVIQPVIPEEYLDDETKCWRFRSDRKKNNRRYLWRLFASRRRMLLRQRPYESRPFCYICGKIRCKEPGCGRTGKKMRDPDLICDRSCKTDVYHGRQLRYGHRAG